MIIINDVTKIEESILLELISLIKRELYMKYVREFMDKPFIKVITGMRRSGKSLLFKLIYEELEEKGVSRNIFKKSKKKVGVR